MKPLIILLISIPLSYCKILRENGQFTANFALVDSNARITSNCIKNITSKCSLIRCVAECASNPDCKTFNHNKLHGVCELLSISKFDAVGLLKKEIYWTHYETDDDVEKLGPICQMLSPCKSYEVCEDTYKAQSRYHCSCKEGFQGDTCEKYIGPGSSQNNTVASCHTLLAKFKSIPDGDYWIKGYDKQRFCGRKVNGGYTAWSNFTPCSTTCGPHGKQQRHRNCTNPPPKNNGEDCTRLGAAVETKECVHTVICNNVKYLFFQTEGTITKDNLIATIPMLFKDWQVEFEVFPISFISKWTNMIHMSIGGDKSEYGDRTPMVNFGPRGRISIDSAVNGEIIFRYKSKKILPLNKWSKIMIKQFAVDNRYVYAILLDNDEAYNVTNSQPKVFENVKVYTSSPWWSAMNGKIRNLVITTAPPKVNKFEFFPTEEILKSNNLLGNIPTLFKDWQVEFEVYPESFKTGWNNIIHFTAGGDSGRFGDRIATVWFYNELNNNERKISIDCAVYSDSSFYTKLKFSRYTTSKRFPLHKWIKVLIKQFADRFGYTYSIFTNDVQVYSVNSTKTQIFDNVKIYAAGIWPKMEVNGKIRSLVIQTKPPSIKPPVDGGYGPWSTWSTCCATRQSRSRLCDQPVPKDGGMSCASLGLPTEERSCNCSLEGEWKVPFTRTSHSYRVTKEGIAIVTKVNNHVYHGTKRTLTPSDDQIHFPSSEGWCKFAQSNRPTAWDYMRINQNDKIEVHHFCSDNKEFCSSKYKELSGYYSRGIGEKII